MLAWYAAEVWSYPSALDAESVAAEIEPLMCTLRFINETSEVVGNYGVATHWVFRDQQSGAGGYGRWQATALRSYWK